MFVTSDIYDLKRIGKFRGFDWRENLLVGIAVYGQRWPGPEAAARFLIEAARQSGCLQQMDVAGYTPSGGSRTRSVEPKSFERLAQGRLRGAKDAVSVLLRGSQAAQGAQRGGISFGDESGVLHRDNSRGPLALTFLTHKYSADFIFSFHNDYLDKAQKLFDLSINILGSEYGYCFLRDDLCFPGAYPYSIAPALDYSAMTHTEAEEIGKWANFARGSTLWTGRPWMRDLYEINLMSPRHASEPVPGLGLLPDWITAEPGRGRISDVGQGRWLWTLTDAEMVAVRPVLNAAGLLVYCIDRVYRDLPGGGRGAAG